VGRDNAKLLGIAGHNGGLNAFEGGYLLQGALVDTLGFQSGLESWKLQAENGLAFLTVMAEIYTSELR
jgi:hypothetical protein